MNTGFSTREVTGDLVHTRKWWVQKTDKDRRAVGRCGEEMGRHLFK